MTRSDLNALADRCEREEASCMLDALIERAINPERRVLFDAGSVQPPVRKAVYGLLRDFPLEKWDDWHAIAQHVGAEDYTTSLDAAVRPEGDAVFWRSGHDGGGPDPSMFKAEVLVYRPNFSGSFFGVARTEPMARRAAELRARAALAEDDTGSGR